MSNIHQLKTSTAALPQIGHNNPPKTPAEWGKYVAEATAMEVAADKAAAVSVAAKVTAIVEKGKRIAQFHDAYKAEGQKWGKRWDEVCQKTLGFNDGIASRYELIAGNVLCGTKDISPPNLDCLYYLARAIRADRKTFDDAAASGEINPTMRRNEAKAVAVRAEATAAAASAARMLQLAQAGHNTTEIARQLGMTIATGGTRNNHQARSLVSKKLNKLGFKPGPSAIRAPQPATKPTPQPKAAPVTQSKPAAPAVLTPVAPTPPSAPAVSAPSQAQQAAVLDQSAVIAALRAERDKLTSDVIRLNALLAAKPREGNSKVDKEIEFLRLGMELITPDDQSIIPDLGLLLRRTFMVAPMPMPDDMYDRNMRRQIESGNPRFIPELTAGFKP